MAVVVVMVVIGDIVIAVMVLYVIGASRGMWIAVTMVVHVKCNHGFRCGGYSRHGDGGRPGDRGSGGHGGRRQRGVGAVEPLR